MSNAVQAQITLSTDVEEANYENEIGNSIEIQQGSDCIWKHVL